MSDELDGFDHLAGKLFQGGLVPDSLPDVVACLAAWLQPRARTIHDVAPPYCPMRYAPQQQNDAPDAVCHMHRPVSPAEPPGLRADDHVAEHRCAVCAVLNGSTPDWHRVIDLFVRCRSLRDVADQASGWAQTSHVAAILLTPTGQVLDCDFRGESFLRTGQVLRLRGSQLCCTDAAVQAQFAAALKETASSGHLSNLLLHAPDSPEKRFSLTLTRMQQRTQVDAETGLKGQMFDAGLGDKVRGVLCLVAPLDGRRIATARQLMDFFGLSAAEARLARAMCHGDSVEEYARDQGLRLPTVRTQLSAIFKKTGTERQAALVRLIAGIPVVRDV